MKIACAVDEIRQLTPDEIKSILDKDKAGEYLLLDVRQLSDLKRSQWGGV